MFQALVDEKINIQVISTEIGFRLIDASLVVPAVQAIHKAFDLCG